MRQYWRDFESLETWSRSEPHRVWWGKFLEDTGGTGFWHETYLRRGGFEAVYVDMFVANRDGEICASRSGARLFLFRAGPRWSRRRRPRGRSHCRKGILPGLGRA